jgi:hypothetical protein
MLPASALGDASALALRCVAPGGAVSPSAPPTNRDGKPRRRAVAQGEVFVLMHGHLAHLDLRDVLRGEYDENSIRKNFTPSEAVAIMRALMPMAKVEAKERQRAHGATAPGRKNTSDKLSEVSKGRAREKVAKTVSAAIDRAMTGDRALYFASANRWRRCWKRHFEGVQDATGRRNDPDQRRRSTATKNGAWH